MTTQLLRQPRAPTVAGVVVMLMALLPGLPKLPFLIVGGGIFLLGRSAAGDMAARALAKREAEEAAKVPAPGPPADAALGDLAIDPLELVIGFGLVPMVDQRAGGGLLSRVGVVRRQIAADLGIVIPAVRIHDDAILDSHEYEVRVRGASLARGRLVPGHRLAINPGEGVPPIGGIPTVEPAFNLPAVWIDESMRGEAEALGYTVVDGESVIVTHLTETIRRSVHELLTRQETRKLLDALKEQNAAAVEEVVPDRLGVGEVQRVLQHLLREGISIRDLGTILETIGDRAAMTRDTSVLAEYARQALGRTITSRYLGDDETLRVISLDPTLEEAVADSLTQTPEGEQIALDPTRAQSLVRSLGTQVDRATGMGVRPVLICSSRVRRHLRRLVEQAFPQLPVVAYNEIAANVRVETTGVVSA
jgi:flagellar biosynthesis protein FlhA